MTKYVGQTFFKADIFTAHKAQVSLANITLSFTFDKAVPGTWDCPSRLTDMTHWHTLHVHV